MPILWLTWEAVASVARPVPWQSPMRALALVRAIDRREQALPFVGADRRHSELSNSELDRLAA